MWFGFDLFHTIWVILSVTSIYLTTREEGGHVGRLLLIGLVLTGGIAVGYEIVRLINEPNSTDFLAVLFMRTFVVVLLGEMAKEKFFPHYLELKEADPLVKLLYALPALAGIPCIVLSFMGHL
jgi:hypothetical protein